MQANIEGENNRFTMVAAAYLDQQYQLKQKFLAARQEHKVKVSKMYDYLAENAPDRLVLSDREQVLVAEYDQYMEEIKTEAFRLQDNGQLPVFIPNNGRISAAHTEAHQKAVFIAAMKASRIVKEPIKS